MYDLPPETIDEEPLIPYVEEAETKDANILIDERIKVEESPSSLPLFTKDKAALFDLFNLAHILHDMFPSGFTWKDYATMIDISIVYLQNCNAMTPLEKREAILMTLNYVIDLTEQHFLPPGTSEPLFESLLIPFIDLALEVRSGKITLPRESAQQMRVFQSEKSSTKRLEEFIKKITLLWQSGYRWHDFAQVARLSILFLITFEKISRTEIREGMRDILHILVETADPTRLPEDFDKSILYSFLDAFSEVIIPAQ